MCAPVTGLNLANLEALSTNEPSTKFRNNPGSVTTPVNNSGRHNDVIASSPPL
jgi:hypothetical protein